MACFTSLHLFIFLSYRVSLSKRSSDSKVRLVLWFLDQWMHHTSFGFIKRSLVFPPPAMTAVQWSLQSTVFDSSCTPFSNKFFALIGWLGCLLSEFTISLSSTHSLLLWLLVNQIRENITWYRLSICTMNIHISNVCVLGEFTTSTLKKVHLNFANSCISWEEVQTVHNVAVYLPNG